VRTQPEFIIRDLEVHPSRLNKEAILESAMEDGLDEFFEGVSMALDTLYTFGVKQVPIKEEKGGQGLSWDNFKQLAESLHRRELTGHAARDAILLAMGVATDGQWNDFYRRILIKDLRCGVSEKTVNKVAKAFKKPNYSVPVFECMLAHDGANHEGKITGKKILQPKLDGVRVITVVDLESNTVTMYSRNGKVLENFSHITEGLAKYAESFLRSMVIDGEIVSSSFQALMKQVHRKDDIQASDARLMVFDMLPLFEFKQGTSTMGQRRRHNFVQQHKEVFDQVGSIDIIPQIEVDLDTFMGELDYKDYNKKAITEGFEGIMIKDPDAKYVCKRHVAWLKQKPFIEVSLTVIETEEGTGRNVGKMGALVCEGVEDGKTIRVNVGSGFSDKDRDEFWSCRVDGQVVEVRADAITQNQDGTYSLRFPRFLRFRGFKAGEKI
jgi:DNA ligase-1